MLTVSQLSKSFSDRVLFRAASFHVNRSDRIGLVGPNGSGKSTLFRLILGDLEPDAGKIAFRNGSRIGYLPQEIAPSGDETVLELATAVSPEITALRHNLRSNPTDSESHQWAQAQLDELRLYELEPKARRILAGLAFRQSDFNRLTRSLSGGWIMRAHLARLLVQAPDLLLLDEPTNHMDIESLIWLQDYLRAYSGAILLISHDREFLNQLVGDILEINRTAIIHYRGNYDVYLSQRAAREEQHLAAYKNQQRQIQSLQHFADRFRAKASKAAQAQSKLKQIERMDIIEAPAAATRIIHFQWPQPPRTGQKVITLNHIDQAYGSVEVYRDLNYTVERGQRTVLVGPNGSGKSTLLKLLAGAIPFQAGARELGLHVRLGYYAQHRIDMLKAGRTVLEEALDTPHPLAEQKARTVLGSFLFPGDDAFKRVSVLSGGEKSRLALVKMLLNPPNCLLMDEPTTHLDMASIDALIEALKQYNGTLIFISHDVYFIRAIATTVLHIQAGQLTPYAGNYDYYLERTRAQTANVLLRAGKTLTDSRPKPNTPSRKTQRRMEAVTRQTRAKALREHQRKLAKLEAEIESLEARQQALTGELENPATYENSSGKPMAINRELTGVVESLAILVAEWEKLAEEDAEPVCAHSGQGRSKHGPPAP
ncbi:MAG: ATP-binding cassette domain-containing protein [Verrucomicrobia bacterium]|nr:ATP-binding cassette domain-containing protein [Verrucomicrobiota bacterium]MBU4291541.1 ATP-binding cassette domain-containing protein [Verrucomicrobiota bacterium]MBU4429110.1 ATP-binding cassette domain-containing protein [Verrucomicrobiota bacterium]MCG2678626.1 ATP-binding cassette domain-containing protein [Kiritimatiellia bacterium]